MKGIAIEIKQRDRQTDKQTIELLARPLSMALDSNDIFVFSIYRAVCDNHRCNKR